MLKTELEGVFGTCVFFILITLCIGPMLPFCGLGLALEVIFILGCCVYLLGGVVTGLAVAESCWYAFCYILVCLLSGFKSNFTRWDKVVWLLKIPYFFAHLTFRKLFDPRVPEGLTGEGWTWRHPHLPRRK